MDYKKQEEENCEICRKKVDCLVHGEGCLMSYIRFNQPLSWFKGNSTAYVYMGDKIVDYDNDYSDLPTLLELIGTFIVRESDDQEYATRIVHVLANKLGVEGKLRARRLTHKQLIRRYISKGAQLRIK